MATEEHPPPNQLVHSYNSARVLHFSSFILYCNSIRRVTPLYHLSKQCRNMCTKKPLMLLFMTSTYTSVLLTCLSSFKNCFEDQEKSYYYYDYLPYIIHTAIPSQREACSYMRVCTIIVFFGKKKKKCI